MDVWNFVLRNALEDYGGLHRTSLTFPRNSNKYCKVVPGENLWNQGLGDTDIQGDPQIVSSRDRIASGFASGSQWCFQWCNCAQTFSDWARSAISCLSLDDAWVSSTCLSQLCKDRLVTVAWLPDAGWPGKSMEIIPSCLLFLGWTLGILLFVRHLWSQTPLK